MIQNNNVVTIIYVAACRQLTVSFEVLLYFLFLALTASNVPLILYRMSMLNLFRVAATLRLLQKPEPSILVPSGLEAIQLQRF